MDVICFVPVLASALMTSMKYAGIIMALGWAHTGNEPTNELQLYKFCNMLFLLFQLGDQGRRRICLGQLREIDCQSKSVDLAAVSKHFRGTS